MSTTIKAIFFDVGNTLLFRNQQAILAPLHQQNIYPSSEQLFAIERRTKEEFDAAMETGSDRGFWERYYLHLLMELAISPDGIREKLLRATHLSANWCEIRPRTREILLRLGRRYHLGVISNADGKIAEVLTRCGIADCFVTITDSGIVGYEKPHPIIFDAALREMKVEPNESLYVGDVYSVDYLGATRAGMQAILFDVSGSYRELGLPRVQSMEELEAVLE